jgi:hypothetical protein
MRPNRQTYWPRKGAKNRRAMAAYKAPIGAREIFAAGREKFLCLFVADVWGTDLAL